MFIERGYSDIYTLSLHDALPISRRDLHAALRALGARETPVVAVSSLAPATGFEELVAALDAHRDDGRLRSEEHTSELQSHSDLVCRLLLEKKKYERRCRQGGPSH